MGPQRLLLPLRLRLMLRKRQGRQAQRKKLRAQRKKLRAQQKKLWALKRNLDGRWYLQDSSPRQPSKLPPKAGDGLGSEPRGALMSPCMTSLSLLAYWLCHLVG